ncbi:MAG: hypothetical protein IJ457_01810 [Clostridia bacterium]|nr:hypothetical protein [Clostridia bacterium]
MAEISANGIRKMGSNRSESFTFAAVPASLAKLKILPEASPDSPFKTAALTVLALTI